MKNKNLHNEVYKKILDFIDSKDSYEWFESDMYGVRSDDKYLNTTKLMNLVHGLIPYIKGNQYIKEKENEIQERD